MVASRATAVRRAGPAIERLGFGKWRRSMAGREVAEALSVLRMINLRALRRHAVRALLAAISLGGGVAVVVAVMIEATSVTKAVEDVGYRVAGPAPLRILGAANRGGV